MQCILQEIPYQQFVLFEQPKKKNHLRINRFFNYFLQVVKDYHLTLI